MKIDLTGRKALVTGGARGIGAGIVCALADCGASVSFTHLNIEKDLEAADRCVCELTEEGKKVFHFSVQAEDMAAMEDATTEASEIMGGLDILVPNVGVNWVVAVEELDLEGWCKGLELNLTTSFIAVKAALPYLLQAKRADVVFIGSSAVLDGGGGGVHYAASKKGVEGLMLGLMRELPRKGVNVNVVNPCVVDTDLLRGRYNTEEKVNRLIAQVPVGRLSTPADVGNLTAFLCSDLGGFICGQSILVDGGRTLWRNT
jgi:3-oxoacyl-[acyl-carrier protein] reductase